MEVTSSVNAIPIASCSLPFPTHPQFTSLLHLWRSAPSASPALLLQLRSLLPALLANPLIQTTAVQAMQSLLDYCIHHEECTADLLECAALLLPTKKAKTEVVMEWCAKALQNWTLDDSRMTALLHCLSQLTMVTPRGTVYQFIQKHSTPSFSFSDLVDSLTTHPTPAVVDCLIHILSSTDPVEFDIPAVLQSICRTGDYDAFIRVFNSVPDTLQVIQAFYPEYVLQLETIPSSSFLSYSHALFQMLSTHPVRLSFPSYPSFIERVVSLLLNGSCEEQTIGYHLLRHMLKATYLVEYSAMKEAMLKTDWMHVLETSFLSISVDASTSENRNFQKACSVFASVLLSHTSLSGTRLIPLLLPFLYHGSCCEATVMLINQILADSPFEGLVDTATEEHMMTHVTCLLRSITLDVASSHDIEQFKRYSTLLWRFTHLQQLKKLLCNGLESAINQEDAVITEHLCSAFLVILQRKPTNWKKFGKKMIRLFADHQTSLQKIWTIPSLQVMIQRVLMECIVQESLFKEKDRVTLKRLAASLRPAVESGLQSGWLLLLIQKEYVKWQDIEQEVIQTLSTSSCDNPSGYQLITFVLLRDPHQFQANGTVLFQHLMRAVRSAKEANRGTLYQCCSQLLNHSSIQSDQVIPAVIVMDAQSTSSLSCPALQLLVLAARRSLPIPLSPPDLHVLFLGWFDV